MCSPVIGIILLADGNEKRFEERGGYASKLLSRITDSSGASVCMFEVVLAQATMSGLPIVVVTRPEYQLIQDLAVRKGARVGLCSSNGSGESIAISVALAGKWDGWIISLADMPWITGGLYLRIKERLISDALQVRLVCNGISDYPVGLSYRYRTALLALKGDEGMRTLINPEILIQLEANESVVSDIN